MYCTVRHLMYASRKAGSQLHEHNLQGQNTIFLAASSELLPFTGNPRQHLAMRPHIPDIALRKEAPRGIGEREKKALLYSVNCLPNMPTCGV